MKRLLILLVALLALVGCQAGSDIVVHPDGSGTYTTIITAEGDAGPRLYDAVVKAASTSGVPMTVAHYSSGNESGARLSCSFRSLDDLAAMSTKLGAAGGGIGGVHVTRGDDGWTFVASSSAGGLVRAPGETQTGAPGGVIDPSALGGLVHMSVSVTLPGMPGTTNATSVSHTSAASKFTWRLDVGRKAEDLRAATMFVGDQRAVQLSTALTPLGSHVTTPAAASSSSGSGNAWVWFVVGGALILVLAAAVLFVVRNRRALAQSS